MLKATTAAKLALNCYSALCLGVLLFHVILSKLTLCQKVMIHNRRPSAVVAYLTP